MTPAELLTWILAYTPILQFLTLYLWFYRYEPSRLFHPSREERGLKAWVAVLTQLKLIEGKVEVRGENSVLRWLMKLFLPTAVLSLFSSQLLWPLLMVALPPALTRLGLPFLLLLQFVPAFYSLMYLRKRYLGSIPLRYLRSVLPLPRQSSIVCHLGDEKWN